MKKKTFFSILIGVTFFISCKDTTGEQTGGKQAPAYPVIEVPLQTVTGYAVYPVSIEGIVNSAVRAKVSGYITEVLVDEGEQVEKGQTLFRLETQTLSQDAGAAKANVNAAEVEVKKLEPLVEKGIISSVQLETARARLAQARANYNSVMANIGYAVIKSPIDGSIGAINFREGSLVGPADPEPLTRVADVEEVYAFFSMNEANFLDFLQHAEGADLKTKISNFPPVQLELANGSLYSHEGTIETVTGQVDPSTGTVSFRAVFPNPNELLISGNSGKIRIPRTYRNMPVIPESSSYEQQGRVYVYRVQGDSMAVSTPIRVKDRVQNLIIIESGIEAGSSIVAQGVGKLRNNMLIQPKPIPFDSLVNAIQPVFK